MKEVDLRAAGLSCSLIHVIVEQGCVLCAEYQSRDVASMYRLLSFEK